MKAKKKKGKFLLQSPKGMHDVLPDEQPYWEKIKKATEKISESYGFSRIDTPAMENAEIFERTGEETDLIEKQMYYVKTKGKERNLVLRPEGTAPTMRSFLQHGFSRLGKPLKLYYFGPMFRYEQPQAGRFRQFHQIGFEIFASEDDPIFDAYAVLATVRLIEELKIKNLIVQINSIGCKQCRQAYIKKLKEYYGNKKDKICKNCQRRLAARPLRLLDCKDEKCQPFKSEAPVILDKLCNGCKNHFKAVLEYLDELAMPYILNHYLVRGLDYYNRTVFEVFSEQSKDIGALASGGRYDNLSEMMGGKKIFATGGSIGVERIIETMKSFSITGALKPKSEVFLVYIGNEAKKKSLAIFEKLRAAGVRISESFGKESLKAQLKDADKEQVKLSLIFGQREVFEESIIVRDMKTGAQETILLEKIAEEVKKRIK
ncbi:MAG: histidine--tRNA ligase [Patescibacteria group bacterium]